MHKALISVRGGGGALCLRERRRARANTEQSERERGPEGNLIFHPSSLPRSQSSRMELPNFVLSKRRGGLYNRCRSHVT